MACGDVSCLARASRVGDGDNGTTDGIAPETILTAVGDVCVEGGDVDVTRGNGFEGRLNVTTFEGRLGDAVFEGRWNAVSAGNCCSSCGPPRRMAPTISCS